MRRRIPAIDTGVYKTCSKCKQEKPIGDFGRNKPSKDGYRSDCSECHSKYWIPYKEKVQPLQRDNHIKRSYGLTREEYQALLDKQQGVCASCGLPQTVNHYGKLLPLAVDHDHKTGEVRGLLCISCNRALGYLFDDPERIEALLRYARNNKNE